MGIPESFGAMSDSTTSAGPPRSSSTARAIASSPTSPVRTWMFSRSSSWVGDRSTPTTRPRGPTRSAAYWSQAPGQQPRSTTRIPGLEEPDAAVDLDELVAPRASDSPHASRDGRPRPCARRRTRSRLATRRRASASFSFRRLPLVSRSNSACTDRRRRRRASLRSLRDRSRLAQPAAARGRAARRRSAARSRRRGQRQDARADLSRRAPDRRARRRSVRRSSRSRSPTRRRARCAIASRRWSARCIGSLTVGTFHSVCARWLRREARALGLPIGFAIYDEADQLAVCRRALAESGCQRGLVPARRATRVSSTRRKNDAADLRAPERSRCAPRGSDGDGSAALRGAAPARRCGRLRRPDPRDGQVSHQPEPRCARPLPQRVSGTCWSTSTRTSIVRSTC